MKLVPACVLRNILLTTLIFSLVVDKAHAGNAACWGDADRQDISCRALTEAFLLSMRSAARSEVIKAMGVNGREIASGLHFASNYLKGKRDGAGDVNFLFDQAGRVVTIYALVDHAHMQGKAMECIWNADKGSQPSCSDFPGSRSRCDD